MSLIDEKVALLEKKLPNHGEDCSCILCEWKPNILKDFRESLEAVARKHRNLARMRFEDLISTYSGSDAGDNLMAEEMNTYDRLLEDPDLNEMLEYEDE